MHSAKNNGTWLAPCPGSYPPPGTCQTCCWLESCECLAARNRRDYCRWRRVLELPTDHGIGGGAIVFQAGIWTNCGGKDHIIGVDGSGGDASDGVVKRIFWTE